MVLGTVIGWSTGYRMDKIPVVLSSVSNYHNATQEGDGVRQNRQSRLADNSYESRDQRIAGRSCLEFLLPC